MNTPTRWTEVEYLHESVTNPNIHIKGAHSYYSNAWDNGLEASVVRYLHGDPHTQGRQPPWPIDQLYIGDYVCIGAEVVILMGGNHNHRSDWLSLYPFRDQVLKSYQGKGDTHIGDGCWLGMRAMLMPGVNIGEGAIVAAQAVVTKDVTPYTLVAGSPAKPVRTRFAPEMIERLLALSIYDWPEEKFEALRDQICADDIVALEQACSAYEADRLS